MGSWKKMNEYYIAVLAEADLSSRSWSRTRRKSCPGVPVLTPRWTSSRWSVWWPCTLSWCRPSCWRCSPSPWSSARGRWRGRPCCPWWAGRAPACWPWPPPRWCTSWVWRLARSWWSCSWRRWRRPSCTSGGCRRWGVPGLAGLKQAGDSLWFCRMTCDVTYDWQVVLVLGSLEERSFSGHLAKVTSLRAQLDSLQNNPRLCRVNFLQCSGGD